MILLGIITLVVALVVGLIALLPTTPAPPDIAGSVDAVFAPISGWLGAANQWVPLDVLGDAVAAMVGYAAIVFGFRLLAWVLCLVHVAGDDAA